MCTSANEMARILKAPRWAFQAVMFPTASMNKPFAVGACEYQEDFKDGNQNASNIYQLCAGLVPYKFSERNIFEISLHSMPGDFLITGDRTCSVKRCRASVASS